VPHPKLLLLALSFYTRLPSPNTQDYTLLPQAAVYLPVIGWLVGGICATGFYLANLLWPQSTAVMIALIIGIFITGAFHEDGFADVCDGFGGGWNKEQILKIMKDSQIGAYGAIGLILMLLMKINLLGTMPNATVPLQLLAGHSVSRMTPLLLMHQYDYSRVDNSKSSIAVFKPGKRDLIFAAILALFPFLLLPTQTLLAVIPILLANWFLGRYFFRHIGGYTGDCLGASQQIAEIVYYLSVTALWTSI
jgi:adenosylcobinamide-GDP ribazoletransferase